MPTKVPTEVLGDVHCTFKEFSRWVPWAARASVKDRWEYSMVDYAGVYLIGHFAETPAAEPADFLDDAILYVGKSNWLVRRLDQFERAVGGGTGHSGGRSYRARYHRLQPDLHVAVLPIWLGTNTATSQEPVTKQFTGWVEAHVLTSLAVHRRDRPGLTLLNK